MWRWLRDEPWFATVPTLTAAAAATTRLRLGVLVANPGLRHPVTFAKELMTLDDVSGGRFTCGVGAGAGEEDERVFGTPGLSPVQRAERLGEFVELTDLLLRHPVTNYDGVHYRARDAWMHPGCVQRPRLPFAVAATGPRGMRLAARYASTWVTAGRPGQFRSEPWPQTLDYLAGQLAQVDAACEQAGRDPGTLDRLLVTGAMVGGVLDSVQAFADATSRLAELGFDDVVVHLPRESFPYTGRQAVLEDIAGAGLLGCSRSTTVKDAS